MCHEMLPLPFLLHLISIVLAVVLMVEGGLSSVTVLNVRKFVGELCCNEENEKVLKAEVLIDLLNLKAINEKCLMQASLNWQLALAIYSNKKKLKAWIADMIERIAVNWQKEKKGR